MIGVAVLIALALVLAVDVIAVAYRHAARRARDRQAPPRCDPPVHIRRVPGPPFDFERDR